MAHAFPEPQKKLIRQLLKVGRWNNESEILRYGLQLDAREVEVDQARNLEPYPSALLAKAYRRMTSRERTEEQAVEKASSGPQPGELE